MAAPTWFGRAPLLQGDEGHVRNRSGRGPVPVERRLDADHPDQASGRSAAAEEARRALVIRTFQRLHHLLSVAGAWRGFLLGRGAGPLLSNGDELGARRQQMGLGSVGSIP